MKYKISICLDHTYMYIVLRVPYTCNFIAIDSIMQSINCRGNHKDANRFAVLTVLWFLLVSGGRPNGTSITALLGFFYCYTEVLFTEKHCIIRTVYQLRNEQRHVVYNMIYPLNESVPEIALFLIVVFWLWWFLIILDCSGVL